VAAAHGHLKTARSAAWNPSTVVNPTVHFPPLSTARSPVEIQIDSDPAQIAGVRRTIERLALEAGFDATGQADLGLCVNEALANVIRHAYGGAPGKPILIRVELTPPGLRIVIRDWGTGVNPAAIPPPPYDPLEPGGVGLICLRGLMDAVNYEPQPDGMRLTLYKQPQPGAP
jgi:anti-sigma regulatory factor (Ser/Thr protein kinase)